MAAPRNSTAIVNCSALRVSQIRRMVLRANSPANGIASGPRLSNHPNACPGFSPIFGSAACQIINGSKGSRPSADALTSGASSRPTSKSATAKCRGVSMVSAPEANCRAAVATAKRTEGSASPANVARPAKTGGAASCRSPAKRALQARNAGSRSW